MIELICRTVNMENPNSILFDTHFLIKMSPNEDEESPLLRKKKKWMQKFTCANDIILARKYFSVASNWILCIKYILFYNKYYENQFFHSFIIFVTRKFKIGR